MTRLSKYKLGQTYTKSFQLEWKQAKCLSTWYSNNILIVGNNNLVITFIDSHVSQDEVG